MSSLIVDGYVMLCPKKSDDFGLRKLIKAGKLAKCRVHTLDTLHDNL